MIVITIFSLVCRHKKIVMNKNSPQISIAKVFWYYLSYLICGLFSHYNDFVVHVFQQKLTSNLVEEPTCVIPTSSIFFIEGDVNEREHLSKLLLCIIVLILL
jgi:hypothetical protein